MSRLLLCFLFAGTLAWAPEGAGQPAADALRAGFGEADITPRIGAGQTKPVFIAGFGTNRQASGVHDPLFARAVVLQHQKQKIALVSVDLVGLFYGSVERIRQALPGFNYVLVSSTHNHEGPDTLGIWGPSLFVSGVDPAYLTKVERGIVAAVKKAEQNLRPVQARIGQASAPELVHDSRLPVVKHDELAALLFQDAKTGENAGLLVQWHCHPETLDSRNTEISADFVAGTVSYLKAKHGCPVVYFTGTVGGLLSSLGVEVKDEAGVPLANGTFAKTERYGQLVGMLADKALAQAEAVRLTPFDVKARPLFLPLGNSFYLLAWKLGVLPRQAFRWQGDTSKAQPADDKVQPDDKLCIRTEIGWLRLGQLDIAAIPGEIYPELVLGKVQDPPDAGADFPDAPSEPAVFPILVESRAASKEKSYCMLFGLANDEIGYIIPKRQWDEKPPFCFGRKKSQYGEINSLGPETAPLLCSRFRELVIGKK